MHFLGCETFYEIYDDLKKLNYIAQLKKIKIMVKLHPNISYLKGKLAKSLPHYLFQNEKIEKILKKTVLTISFSSTIEDSLCSKIPVILFDQWKRFKHCRAEVKIKHYK